MIDPMEEGKFSIAQPSSENETGGARRDDAMEAFAKLIRAILRAAGRLKPAGASNPYRPEKHYMRGAGPKSKRVPPARRNGASNAS